MYCFARKKRIEQTYCSENLPQPLFALHHMVFRLCKEGKFLPFVKGGKEGFSLQGLRYFGLPDNYESFKPKSAIAFSRMIFRRSWALIPESLETV